MSTITLINQARQLLEILDELEKGKAYDLDQLGEHIGVKNKKELHEVALVLQDQGCAEIIEGEDESGSPIVAVALRSLDFDPGLVTRGDSNETKEQTGEIVSTTIDIASNPMDKPQRAKSQPPQTPRIDVKFTTPPSQQTATEDGPNVGELTIEQILHQLADAVEQADSIDGPQKYPLLEKIRSVASHPAIEVWLKTPLKKIV